MSEFYWHIHHGILMEPLAEPIESRIQYIRTEKSTDEIETRLRLLKPVRGKLSDEIVKVGADFVKALEDYYKWLDTYGKKWTVYSRDWTHSKEWEAYMKAKRVCNKKWEDYKKAFQDHKTEIESLHAAECPDCSWNGTTIFPGR